ncbi:MAG TPA: hypothetical protein VN799_03455 [Acidimicrobiales bacterium]|nr:hypothetical protein [Acidimicrobiales bacterium]
MGFRAEKKRLADALGAGEEILASDPLAMIEERPELNVLSRPVLVVTDRSIFLILSGKQPEVSRIGIDALAGVEREDDKKLGSTLRLTMTDGEVRTFVYEPRAPTQATADLITERFIGRNITDTSDTPSPPED